MDPVILASILNFLAVVAILFFAARKPFAAMLADRSDQVRKSMTEAEALSSEAQGSLTKWESSWNGRDAYLRQQMEEAKVALVNQRERALVAAKSEAERIQKDAELMGSSEVVRAKRSLQVELVEKSVAMAGGYLGKNLSEKDQQKLITEYVDLVSHGTR